MDDEERRQWVMNDEGMYRWYLSSRMGVYAFIKKNRKEITEAINKSLAPTKAGWQEDMWHR